MNVIGNEIENGVIPGDNGFKFRSRAKKLCKKWKPFIIRDIRAFPYRWKFDGHQVNIRWHPPSHGKLNELVTTENTYSP